MNSEKLSVETEVAVEKVGNHSIVVGEELNRGRIAEILPGEQRKDTKGIFATESCHGIPAI